jgi:hypothetical protein
MADVVKVDQTTFVPSAAPAVVTPVPTTGDELMLMEQVLRELRKIKRILMFIVDESVDFEDLEDDDI